MNYFRRLKCYQYYRSIFPESLSRPQAPPEPSPHAIPAHTPNGLLSFHNIDTVDSMASEKGTGDLYSMESRDVNAIMFSMPVPCTIHTTTPFRVSH